MCPWDLDQGTPHAHTQAQMSIDINLRKDFGILQGPTLTHVVDSLGFEVVNTETVFQVHGFGGPGMEMMPCYHSNSGDVEKCLIHCSTTFEPYFLLYPSSKPCMTQEAPTEFHLDLLMYQNVSNKLSNTGRNLGNRTNETPPYIYIHIYIHPNVDLCSRVPKHLSTS